jgi:hypothetical protein
VDWVGKQLIFSDIRKAIKALRLAPESERSVPFHKKQVSIDKPDTTKKDIAVMQAKLESQIGELTALHVKSAKKSEKTSKIVKSRDKKSKTKKHSSAKVNHRQSTSWANNVNSGSESKSSQPPLACDSSS